MSADGVNYKDVLVTCKVKVSDDGQFGVLDLPFPIYTQNVVCDCTNYGAKQLPIKLVEKNVLANVHYMLKHPVIDVDDTEKVEKFKGVINDFQNDLRVKLSWTVKKKDFYRTIDSKTGEIVEYTKDDKDDLVPFCWSPELMPELKVVVNEKDPDLVKELKVKY